MSRVIKHNVRVEIKANIVLELTEQEARALDGIFGYNVDVFLKVFKERMGSHYVERYEDGVRSLHQTIRGVLARPLSDIDKARKQISASPSFTAKEDKGND